MRRFIRMLDLGERGWDPASSVDAGLATLRTIITPTESLRAGDFGLGCWAWWRAGEGCRPEGASGGGGELAKGTGDIPDRCLRILAFARIAIIDVDAAELGDALEC
jgi:hypothetical protein